MKYCPKCGFGMDSEAPFCGNCGFDFRSVKLPREPQPVIQPLQQIPREPEVSEQSAPARPSAPEQPKKKSKALIIVLIIVGVLLIGVGTLFVLESKDIINFFDGIGSDKDTENASGEAVTDEDGNVIFSGETEKIWFLSREDKSNGDYIEYAYDISKNKVTKNWYSEGKTYLYVESTYDKKGNLLKNEETAFLADRELTNSNEYTYDENGNELTKTHFVDGEEINFYENVYDTAGNKIMYTEYKNGEKISYTEYTYTGNKTRTKTVYENGVKTSYSDYIYAEDGSSLFITTYNADGEIETRTEIYYNEAGKVLSNTRYLSNGTVEISYIYTYDENGNTLTSTAGGMYGNTYKEYTYDENGNEKSATVYNEDKTEYKYTSEYTWEEIDVPVECAEIFR